MKNFSIPLLLFARSQERYSIKIAKHERNKSSAWNVLVVTGVSVNFHCNVETRNRSPSMQMLQKQKYLD